MLQLALRFSTGWETEGNYVVHCSRRYGVVHVGGRLREWVTCAAISFIICYIVGLTSEIERNFPAKNYV